MDYFGKVLVRKTRERSRGWNSYRIEHRSMYAQRRGGKQSNLEDLPFHESMHIFRNMPDQGIGCLPAERWVYSQVGKNCGDAYSEYTSKVPAKYKHFKYNSFFSLVDYNAYFDDDGELQRSGICRSSNSIFYVNPITGIIERSDNEYKEKWYGEPVDNYSETRKTNGDKVVYRIKRCIKYADSLLIRNLLYDEFDKRKTVISKWLLFVNRIDYYKPNNLIAIALTESGEIIEAKRSIGQGLTTVERSIIRNWAYRNGLMICIDKDGNRIGNHNEWDE